MSQSQIDICLNCTKAFCTGTCKLIQDEINIWCIKKTRTLKNGEIKKSYIYNIKGKVVNSRTDVNKAKKFSVADAKRAIKKLRKIAKTSDFEIVRWSDEIEKNNKNVSVNFCGDVDRNSGKR